MYSYVVTPRSCTLLCVDLPKSVVAHLVHKAVEQCRGTFTVNAEFTLRSKVVSLLNVSTLLCTTTNTNHPKELIDICMEGQRRGERGGGGERERERERERDVNVCNQKDNSCHSPSEA